jgi:hypothetical protein
LRAVLTKVLKNDLSSILEWDKHWPIFIPLFSLILWFLYWQINKRIMKQGGMGNELEDKCFELWKNISPEGVKPAIKNTNCDLGKVLSDADLALIALYMNHYRVNKKEANGEGSE